MERECVRAEGVAVYGGGVGQGGVVEGGQSGGGGLGQGGHVGQRGHLQVGHWVVAWPRGRVDLSYLGVLKSLFMNNKVFVISRKLHRLDFLV